MLCRRWWEDVSESTGAATTAAVLRLAVSPIANTRGVTAAAVLLKGVLQGFSRASSVFMPVETAMLCVCMCMCMCGNSSYSEDQKFKTACSVYAAFGSNPFQQAGG
jgi:hypothetical protein